jgi:hypothetical protein
MSEQEENWRTTSLLLSTGFRLAEMPMVSYPVSQWQRTGMGNQILGPAGQLPGDSCNLNHL